jgi:hypothetical protein
MTKVIRSLLMFAIAASVVFQGTALAVMVGCHTGSTTQSPVNISSIIPDSEHCVEHMAGKADNTHASVDPQSNERPCCSCDAIYKAKLDVPVSDFDVIEAHQPFSSSFPSVIPSAELSLPYRPPILV